jgi:D-glycero-D-manno-heptose 1,7-bisphosphate phosphatase
VSFRPAAFLDRDGVINAAAVRDGRPHPPASLEDLHILPGVAEACRRLRAAGLWVLVVTNQPDIARGATSAVDVARINDELLAALAIDAILVCPHDDIDDCACRKPRPGLLLDAADRFGIDLGRSTMVGDRWRDIDAGRAAGVSTVFLDRSYAERRPTDHDRVASELITAIPFILERAEQGASVP